MNKLIQAIVLALLGVACTIHIFCVSILGARFGWTDNIIVVVGGFFGAKLAEKMGWNPGVGAGVGSGVANTGSDDVGAIIDAVSMGMSWVPGITYGCLVPLLFIPIFTIISNRYIQIEK